MIEKTTLLIDFDMLAYSLNARGLEVRQIENGIFQQVFSMPKAVEEFHKAIQEYKDVLLQRDQLEVERVELYYTQPSFSRRNYYKSWLDFSYKATRKKTATASSFGVEIIKANIYSFDTPVYDTIFGLECDDMLSIRSSELASQGEHSIIVSADKDFKPAHFMLNPMNMQYSAPDATVIAKLLVIGDASDNVAGVKGMGDKAFKTLLSTSPSDFDLINKVEEIYKEKGLDFDRAYEMLVPLMAHQISNRNDLGYTINLSTCSIDVDLVNESYVINHKQSL